MPSSRSTTRRVTAEEVFGNMRSHCPHCGKELKREAFELFGKPRTVTCYGSCGCEESKLDGEDVRPDEKRYALAGIPRAFLSADCDTSLQFDVFDGRSLYIHGPYGSGKTHLACVIAKRLLNMGRSVFFTSMPNLVKAYQDAYGGKRSDVFDRAHGCDVLVLDDFGKEKVTPDTLYIAFLLIDGRYAARRPSVFTSNFSRGMLGSRMAEADAETAQAIVSRLNENTLAIELACGDRRLA